MSALSANDWREINNTIQGLVQQDFAQRAWDWAKAQLESMPGDSYGRCEIGQAFEKAVMRVVTRHETWDADNGTWAPVLQLGTENVPMEANTQDTVAMDHNPDEFPEYGLMLMLVDSCSKEGIARILASKTEELRQVKAELAQAVSETMRPTNTPEARIGHSLT